MKNYRMDFFCYKIFSILFQWWKIEKLVYGRFCVIFRMFDLGQFQGQFQLCGRPWTILEMFGSNFTNWSGYDGFASNKFSVTIIRGVCLVIICNSRSKLVCFDFLLLVCCSGVFKQQQKEKEEEQWFCLRLLHSIFVLYSNVIWFLGFESRDKIFTYLSLPRLGSMLDPLFQKEKNWLWYRCFNLLHIEVHGTRSLAS